MTHAAQSQSGVMLIEALVGILIFSIGILALIGMQGAAMRNTNDAKYRSEAAFLASEIIGRMWVDMDNLAKYGDDYASAYAPRDDWRQKVVKTLPGVDLSGATKPSIVHTPVGSPVIDNEVTVIVLWQQPGESAVRRVQIMNRINPGQ